MKPVYATLIILSLFISSIVSAQSFSWSNHGNGNTSNSQSNAGITMSTVISGPGHESGYPRYSSSGGGNLTTSVDWNNKTSSVTVTVTFSKPLTGITFLLFDVDQSTNWDDKVTVTGVNGNSQSVYPVITANSYTTVSGANSNIIEGKANNNSFTNEPAKVSFGRHPVKTLTIVYGAGTSSPANPVSQTIGIGNLVYENVLPLDLISFQASKKNNVTELKWEAENQENFSHFEVERSANGTEGFETIATVFGTNDLRGAYSFADAKAARLMQKAFYRLKMIDKDGSFKYSAVMMIAFEQAPAVLVSPTLLNAGEMITVSIAGNNPLKYDVKIFDMSGKLMAQQSGNGRMQFNSNQFRKGMYIVSATGAGQTTTAKIMVQ